MIGHLRSRHHRRISHVERFVAPLECHARRDVTDGKLNGQKRQQLDLQALASRLLTALQWPMCLDAQERSKPEALFRHQVRIMAVAVAAAQREPTCLGGATLHRDG